jgi:RNA polymerase sigma-70 factor (ECF subfamily)
MIGALIPLRRVGSSAESLSDEALLAACALGDPAALGALYDRYHEAVYRFLGRFLSGYPDDHDDVVQATFLQAQRSAGKFQRGSPVRTWLIGIAANQARHHVRGEQRRKAAMSSYAEHPQPASEGPERSAEQSQLLRRLAEALAELPHDLRVPFVMCDVEGIPGVDAARAVGVAPGTFSRRLFEARQSLRKMLQEAI